ncbi:MAG: RNA polymerase sigma factor [Nannocystis sp.]|nr:RNA polymerase sigma factor [Nannocystis sp.]MBA3547667.1 RNA polymerase sigma factor [Nannocystis sp.]
MDRDLLVRALRPLLPELTRFARWVIGSPGEADDLVQEVVLRALQHGAEIQEPARLKAWLFRCTRNAHIDALRARAARERLVVLDGGELDACEVPAAPLPAIERIDLERALAELPEYARTVILLAEVWQFSYDEIACILDIPLGTVRSRVSRARARLAASLAAPVARGSRREGGGT